MYTIHSRHPFDRAALDATLGSLALDEPVLAALGHVFDFDLAGAVDRVRQATVASWEDLLGCCAPGLATLLLRAMAGGAGARHEIGGDMQITEPTVYVGDLVVGGSLEVSSSLLVGGTLSAAAVCDVIHESVTVVAGDLEARAVETESHMTVFGALRARVVRCGGNDCSLVVAGDLRADILDQEDHDIGCYGELAAPLHFSFPGWSGTTQAASGVADRLDPALLHEPDEYDNVIDWSKLVEHAVAGGSLLST